MKILVQDMIMMTMRRLVGYAHTYTFVSASHLQKFVKPQQLSFGRNLARGRSAQNAFATLVERHLERKSAREVKTTAIGSSRRDWISSISVRLPSFYNLSCSEMEFDHRSASAG